MKYTVIVEEVINRYSVYTIEAESEEQAEDTLSMVKCPKPDKVTEKGVDYRVEVKGTAQGT